MKIDASTVRVEIEERNEESLGASPSLFVTIYARPHLGLDRDHFYGWSVGPAGSLKSQKLAERLKAAVLAGAAITGEAEPKKDVKNRTYLSGGSAQVSGRRLNADLLRLGF